MNKFNQSPIKQRGNICVMINSMAGGGAEKVVATLFSEFRRSGAQVSLLCLEKNNFYVIEDADPVFLSSQTGSDEGGFRKLSSLVSFALKLKKYIAKNQIQQVQSHIYRSNYVNVLARLLGANHKVQVVNHGMPSQYLNEGISGRINRILIKWLYPKADQVICPSNGMIEEFVELGVPEDRTQLIRNPFDIDKIIDQSKIQLTPEEFEFEPHKRYIVSIGRLQPVKRTEDIVWAFYELQKRVKDVELLILGEGEKEHDIEALVMRLSIGKKVHLTGQVENPHKYLARSNALVLASEFEGFSNVIVEALATGVPVVSTDCRSGPREILDPHKSRDRLIAPGDVEQVRHGLMVPVGDIKALTRAMGLVLGEPDVRQQISRGGRERVRQFDKTTIAKTYLQHLYRLIGENP